MAQDEFDYFDESAWTAIGGFMEEDEPAGPLPAIPEPTTPSFESDPLIDPSAYDPVQDIDFEPKFDVKDVELGTAFVEGAKGVVRGFEETASAPFEIAKDILPSIFDRPIEAAETAFLQLLPAVGTLDLMRKMGTLDQNREYYERLQGKNKYEQFAENFVSIAPQMAMNMVAGGVAGKVGAATSAGIQIFGSQYENYKKEGRTPTQAASLALADTGMQLPIETLSTMFMLKGAKAFKMFPGTKQVYDAISKGISRLGVEGMKSAVGRVAQRLLGGAAIEGAEEFLQSLTETVTAIGNYIYENKGVPNGEWIKKTFDSKVKEGTEAALLGAAWGFTGAGAGMAAQKLLPDANPDSPAIEDVTEIKTKSDAQAILERTQMAAMESEQMGPAIPEPTLEEQVGVIPEEPPMSVRAITDQPPAMPVEPEAELSFEDLANMPLEELENIPLGTRAAAVAGPEAAPKEITRLTREAEAVKEKAAAKKILDEIYPEHGLRVDAIGEEGTTLPPDKIQVTATAPESPIFKATFDLPRTMEPAEVRAFVAKREMEFIRVKRSKFQKDVKSRPSWATKLPYIESPKTESQRKQNQVIAADYLKMDLVKKGESAKRSDTVKLYEKWLTDQYELNYGKNFVKQIDQQDLTSEQVIISQMMGEVYDKDVFFVELTGKAETDLANPVHRVAAANFPNKNAVVITQSMSENPINSALHEITHQMEKDQPKLWKMIDLWIKDPRNVDQTELDKVRQKLLRKYKDPKQTEKEVVSFYVGEVMSDPASFKTFAAKLSESNPSLFKRFIDFLVENFKKLKRYAGKYGFAEFSHDIDQTIEFLSDMLVEYAAALKGAPTVYAEPTELELTDMPATPKRAIGVINQVSRGVRKIKLTGKSAAIEADKIFYAGLGFEDIGNNVMRLPEDMPNEPAIIAGNFEASWNKNLFADPATASVLNKILKRHDKETRARLGKNEFKKYQDKVENYLKQSWLTYNEAANATRRKGNLHPIKNVRVKSGKSKQLILQVSSNYAREEATAAGDYYFDKLYSKRKGYLRPDDFWEVPTWAAVLSNSLPDGDFYVVRNIEEAIKFIKASEYEAIFVSSMDANKDTLKRLVQNTDTKFIVGGYADPSYFKGVKNIITVDTFEKGLAQIGKRVKPGVDYRIFNGTQTIPRLELSQGCKHKCAFCTVPKTITTQSPKSLNDQIKSFAGLDYRLIYLNDKTFGQAKNYKLLERLYKDLKKMNPKFEGFIIQTTAPAFNKMDDDFIVNSGIKYVELGMESFNDDILEKVNKPHRTGMIRDAVNKIRRLRLNFIPNVMVGLAGVYKGKLWTETPETYQNTLDFMKDNQDIISHVNAYVLATYEGTALADQLGTNEIDSDENVIKKSWLKNQEVHEKFYQDVLDFGSEQLEKTPEPEMELDDQIPYQIAKVEMGAPGSPSHNVLQWDMFKIAEQVGGMDKVADYIDSLRIYKGFPVNERLKKWVRNRAAKLSKDPKLFKKFESIEKMRDDLAEGKRQYTDPDVAEFIKKYSRDVELHTIRHTGQFHYSKTQIYGKPTKKQIAKSKTFDRTHVLTGPFKETVHFDKEGRKFVPGPIWSENRATRLKQIEKVVKKNIKFSQWYQKWSKFFHRFRNIPEIERLRIIAISGMLGQGKGPQQQMKLTATAINELTTKGVSKKAASATESVKINDTWHGRYDELLKSGNVSKMAEVFGPKIGTYMLAGAAPDSPAVLVIDRHMPKPWGYNVLNRAGYLTEKGNMGGYNVHPRVEYEIWRDIKEVSDKMGVPVAGVQAAIWYESRAEDTTVSEIHKVGQIKPSVYIPEIMHRETYPETGAFLHYKKTPIKQGDFILASGPRNKIEPNTYSLMDIGERISGATRQWPYQELVYMYEAGTTPETKVRQGRKAYSFKFDPKRIYDAIEDPYNFRETVAAIREKDRDASETNILAKLIKQTGDYDAFLASSPYNPKQRWLLVFEEVMVEDYPELTNIGISDVVESIETVEQDVVKAVLAGYKRRSKLHAEMKETQGLRYPELVINRASLAVARFPVATGGQIEHSLALKLDGPLRSQRAFLSEFGIKKMQRQVYLMHEPREGRPANGILFTFKADKRFDNIKLLYDSLMKAGLHDFNIVQDPNTGSLFIEQYVFEDDVNQAKLMAEVLKSHSEPGHPRTSVREVHSEILGHEKLAKSISNYFNHIREHWREAKAKEILNEAIRARKDYRKELFKRAQKEIDRDTDGFDPSEPSQHIVDSPVWNSSLIVQLENPQTPQKMKAVGWGSLIKSWIKKGFIKKAEVEWTQLDELLGRVEPGEVLERDYIVNWVMSYSPEIREEILREKEKVFSDEKLRKEFASEIMGFADELYDRGDISGNEYNDLDDTLGDFLNKTSMWFKDPQAVREWFEAQDLEEDYEALFRRLSDKFKIRPTQYDEYALSYDTDHFENYREFLITLEATGRIPGKKFLQHHWSDYKIPNLLVHTRINDYIDPNGNKYLNIDEIQSDWFAKIKQQDRALAFYKISKKDFIRAHSLMEKIGDLVYGDTFLSDLRDSIKKNEYFDYWLNNKMFENQSPSLSMGKPKSWAEKFGRENLKNLWEVVAAMGGDFNYGEGYVETEIPFDKTYGQIALKRMVKYAVDNGYDGLSITPGIYHINRYALEKHFSKVHYDGENELLTYRQGQPGSSFIGPERNHKVSPYELHRYIGKEAAEKVLERIEKYGKAEPVDILEIKTTGKGMLEYYDKIVPNALNKMFNKAKWGKAKVRVGAVQEEGMTLHILDFTKEMKEKVAVNPMPMFELDDPPATVMPALNKIGRSKVPLSQKIRDRLKLKRSVTTSIIDHLNPIKRYLGKQSKGYMLHRGLPGLQSSINAMMEHGKLNLTLDGVLTTTTRKEGFVPWLRSIGKDSEKFFYWLIATRDKQRTKKDPKYIATFTDKERNAIFDWVGDKPSTRDSWSEINDEFQEWNESVLKIGVDSGLLDDAVVKQFKDEFYIPFYRIFEDAEANAEFIKTPVNTKKIISDRIKKLKGTKEYKIGDPMENILANWSHLIKASMANQARREAFLQLDKNNILDENGEKVVEEVSWKDTVIFRSGDDTTFVYPKDEVEVLGYKDNGKTVFFKVNDPELLASMSLVNNFKMNPILRGIFAIPKRMLTFGATITPTFMLRNMFRDTVHTFTISDNFKPFWGTLVGFIKTLKKDQDFVEYMASGNAFVGSYVKADRPESFKKYTDKIIRKEGRGALGRILNTPGKVWSFWEGITEASENAARLYLYSQVKKKDGDRLKAAFAARDIMDFQMRGAAGPVQFLNATIPFLNARMQGLYRMGTAARENPKAYLLKGSMIAAASMALWLAYKDDERYKELEDWEKFQYYHWWIGDKHYRLPKPFETGVIWSSLWTAAADSAMNSEWGHLVSFMAHSMADTFAFNPVPQAVRPIAEQYMNKSFFTGRPIVPYGMRYKPAAERYEPWDSETARVLGQVLGVSPRRITALIRGYFASFGMGLLGLSDIITKQAGDFPERPAWEIDDYPVIGAFIKKSKPKRYTRYMTEFYDIFNELRDLSAEIKIAETMGDYHAATELRMVNWKRLSMYSKAKSLRTKLGNIKKQIKSTWTSDISAEEKRNKLNLLQAERNRLTKEFYEYYLSQTKDS